LERRPVPQTVYDQYPTTEWAAIPRNRSADNAWSSCGIANVTGLKFDRVECKFITDRIISGRSEVEIRLAAFRHPYGSQFKDCVSATSVMRLTGTTIRSIGVGRWRWIHGIPFGWDYSDTDDAVYTIELQHRNPNDMPQRPDNPAVRQMFGYFKMSNETDIWDADLVGSAGIWAAGLRPSSDNTIPPMGWIDVQDRDGAWTGAYHISNMHYCVGLPADRLPEASVPGWFVLTNGGGVRFARDADITEPYTRI
jgi:hypothetical protein